MAGSTRDLPFNMSSHVICKQIPAPLKAQLNYPMLPILRMITKPLFRVVLSPCSGAWYISLPTTPHDPPLILMLRLRRSSLPCIPYRVDQRFQYKERASKLAVSLSTLLAEKNRARTDYLQRLAKVIIYNQITANPTI